MDNPTNPADGTYIVVENGQRVTGPLENRDQAEAEAKRRNSVAESAGKTVPEGGGAQVKRNLCG